MDAKTLTVGSLFSGIGGLELGLERTGGFKTIWNCEIEPYPSEVLKRHWPNVPNLGDITKVNWDAIERPDVICGGFPCQDISIAGKGKGIVEGKRSGLWVEFRLALCVLQPKYALVENVPMLARRGLDVVLADIASFGYDAEWQIISASSVGAPHKRERMFIIAHANDKGEYRSPGKTPGWGRMQTEPVYPFIQPCDLYRGKRVVEPLVCREDYGLSRGMDRIKALGNAVVPACAEIAGRRILEIDGEINRSCIG